MPKHFERDLARLRRELLDMVTRVEEAIDNAVRALRDRDVALAREVIGGDDEIDQADNSVQEGCLKLLALYQPVAGDLRRVAATLRIRVDLERMADLAAHVAERAVHLACLPPVPAPAGLARVADLTIDMARRGLGAFVREDAREARRVCRLDDQVDQLAGQVIRDLIGLMRQGPEMVEAGLSLFSATRHLERIADHATYVAEEALYLVEGEIAHHRPEAIDRDS